jgi:excinuclease ABC subunit C
MHYYQRLLAFQTLLQLPNLPQRIECFDVSHTMGEATVASCVVFDDKGPVKNAYRRFNITDVTPGDDYAALQQALTRRYTRLKAHDGSQIPDVLIIDGGKGQLSTAEAVIEELQVSGVTLIAVAKGPTRKPGMETLFVSKRSTPLEFSADSPALHLIQQIRDEAHRFAIVGHRQKQLKTRSKSFLENIPGIGAKRRRDLLRHFGGLQEIKNASVDELAKVQGISWDLAIRIYEALH